MSPSPAGILQAFNGDEERAGMLAENEPSDGPCTTSNRRTVLYSITFYFSLVS